MNDFIDFMKGCKILRRMDGTDTCSLNKYPKDTYKIQFIYCIIHNIENKYDDDYHNLCHTCKIDFNFDPTNNTLIYSEFELNYLRHHYSVLRHINTASSVFAANGSQEFDFNSDIVINTIKKINKILDDVNITNINVLNAFDAICQNNISEMHILLLGCDFGYKLSGLMTKSAKK